MIWGWAGGGDKLAALTNGERGKIEFPVTHENNINACNWVWVSGGGHADAIASG